MEVLYGVYFLVGAITCGCLADHGYVKPTIFWLIGMVVFLFWGVTARICRHEEKIYHGPIVIRDGIAMTKGSKPIYLNREIGQNFSANSVIELHAPQASKFGWYFIDGDIRCNRWK